MSVTGDEGRRNVMQHMRAMGLGDPSTAAGTLTEEQLRDLQAEADLRVETTRGARFEMQGDDINAIKIYKSQAALGCTTSMAALANIYVDGATHFLLRDAHMRTHALSQATRTTLAIHININSILMYTYTYASAMISLETALSA